MAHEVLVLLAVAAASSVTQAAYDRTVCDTDAFRAQSRQNPGPTKPLLASRFGLRVEANLDDYNKTMDIHEFYDFPGNRGAISQWDRGQHTQVYFDYNTGQVMAVTYPDDVLHHDIVCEVSSLAACNSSFIFGTQPFSNGTQHIFSVGDSLRMAVTQPELYLGVLQTTDGAIAEVWRACIYMASLDATFNATWYFTANNTWTSTLGPQIQTPLSLQVTGSVGGQNAHAFDHVYVFSEYQPDSVDVSDLETPPGVFCDQRNNTKPLPNISDIFSYRTEIVDTATSYINYMSEYYYLSLRTSQYEYQPEMGSTYGSNPIRRVHDFRTGVAYVTDTILGNCTVIPISKLSNDATSPDNVHVRMKSEKEFFGFNDKFTYAGQRVARDIDCDVWVAVKVDWPADGPFQTTWEWYFATRAWLERVGSQYEALLPVMLRITAQDFDPPFERIYNIYDYTEGQINKWDFDISSCFNRTHRIEYILTFPGSYKVFVAPSLTNFRDQFLMTATSVCQVSFLRVAHIRVDYDDVNIYVSFSLLDQAPVAGDATLSEPETSLQEASDRLQSAVTWHTFTVSVPLPNGNQVAQLAATNFSIGVAPTPQPQATPPYPTQQQRRPRGAEEPNVRGDLRFGVQKLKSVNSASATYYSKGSVVGLGVAMVLVGYACGFALMLLAHRRLMRERAPAFLNNPLRELPLDKIAPEEDQEASGEREPEELSTPQAELQPEKVGSGATEELFTQLTPHDRAEEHPYVLVPLDS